MLLIAAAVALAAFVQGASGLGFALIIGPVVGILRPDLVPVTVLVLMVPLNFYIAWRERDHVDRHGAGWVSAGRIAGTGGGLAVLLAVPASHLDVLIGASTMIAALASLASPAFTPNRRALIAAGAITGITETATGVGGPPLALVYQHRAAPVLRSTIAVCFLIGELVSLALLLALGRSGPDQIVIALLLLPALALGALASRLVHRRLNQRWMRILVLAFAFVSGLALLLKA